MEPINPPGTGAEGHNPSAAQSRPQEAPSVPHVAPEAPPQMDEAALMRAIAEQQQAIQNQMAADAHTAVNAENPTDTIALPSAAPAAPEPEAVLHAPPAKQSPLVAALTQVKDKLMQLFKGIKKALFAPKAPPPPRPTTFKNFPTSGAASPVSFK